MAETVDLRDLRGLVATIVLTGQVESRFSECLTEMRSWCDRHEMYNVEWRQIGATLVEAGRDGAVQHALNEDYDWILQVDADATFEPDSLYRIMRTAHETVPDADAVGAYCQLKGSYSPTIDTGTGHWETHYPNSGVLPVIRTGAHFLFCKTAAFSRFGPPWFRTRQTYPPAKALAEVDNFARITLDGRNPLSQHPEWTALVKEARKQGDQRDNIGEDSGFCDRLRHYGGRIYVDTDIVTGHVARTVIGPQDLKDKIDDIEEKQRRAVGILE